MNVGVLGSGEVGKALASGFLRHGHSVTIGTREPSALTEWARGKPELHIGSVADAARFGSAIVLAVKGSAAIDALRMAGADNLAGKIVIDVTNPIADLPPENGVIRYFTSLDESLMERLQREVPQARLVKAFNQVNSGHMVDPDYGGVSPTMFICGNDDEAKRVVSEILVQFGWEPEDMGGVEAARAIEPLCMLWVLRYVRKGQSTHAFKLLR